MITERRKEFYDLEENLIGAFEVDPNIVATRKTVRLIQYLDRFFRYDTETESYREAEGVFNNFTVVG